MTKTIIYSLILFAGLTAPAIASEDLKEAIDQTFAEEGFAEGSNYKIETSDGVVTLSGYADSLVSRRYAIELVQTLSGVKAVIDRLIIKESSRSDEEITDDLVTTLAVAAGVDKLPSRFKVNDGVVTLTGSASSLRMREVLERAAESIRGVRSVTNMLKVERNSKLNDAEIQQFLNLAFADDAWIDEDFVKISVNDGIVTLVGAVDSGFEKQRMISSAQVTGARTVNADDLEVSPGLRPAMSRPHPPFFRSDSELKAALELALQKDHRVRADGIEINVADGDITLTGTVPSIGAKASAESDAINLPGAESVSSFLTVSLNTRTSDEVTKQNLELLLKNHAVLSEESIEVSSENGTITLKGSVESKFARRMAVRLAAFMPGTQVVKNMLRVEWQTETAALRSLNPGRYIEL
ncbi:MAG: BON domain-containing protein [Verrucomicrobiales bacterium]|nr:BON domain-containing protein [Verrucomicrobiales bacterium]